MKQSKPEKACFIWELGERKSLPDFLADSVKYQQRPRVDLRLCPQWDSKTVRRSSVLPYTSS